MPLMGETDERRKLPLENADGREKPLEGVYTV
jgi:hypothetical protein